MSYLVTGDDTDVSLAVQTSAGVAVDISTATSVKARLVAYDRSAALTPTYTLTNGYGGSTWNTGAIVVPVLGTDTDGIVTNSGAWEVQVILGGKKTTYLDTGRVNIIKGYIP